MGWSEAGRVRNGKVGKVGKMLESRAWVPKNNLAKSVCEAETIGWVKSYIGIKAYQQEHTLQWENTNYAKIKDVFASK